MLPIWKADKHQICRKIRSSWSILKLVLKTKNDAYFLEDWVTHHARIVGIENLIIADNGSTDDAVLEFYAKNQDLLCIFSFEGLHNAIHSSAAFPEMYSALRSSCDFFQIIDTDERLIWAEEDTYIDDDRIVNALSEFRQSKVIPGVWLSNFPRSDSIVIFGPKKRLMNSLKWGKSLFSATLEMPKTQCLHNCQVPEEAFLGGGPPRAWLLHLCNSSIDQRLKANREKLLARGAISAHEPYEEIAKRVPSDGAPHATRFFLNEVKSLVAERLEPRNYSNLAPHTIELKTDGSYRFGVLDTRSLFQALFTDSAATMSEALRQ